MENYLRDKVGDWNVEYGSKELPACEHCRSVKNLTKHHLIPRSTRRIRKVHELLTTLNLNPNTKIVLCERCHVKLHQVRTNKELALEFNTPGKVLELLGRYENSSAHERLNRLRFDEEYADVFEGSNMWN